MNLLKFIVPLFLLLLSLNAQTTDRMIIKYKNTKTLNKYTSSNLALSISNKILPFVRLKMMRKNKFHTNIMKVDIAGKRPSFKQMKSLAKELSSRNDIEYAEPDYINKHFYVPNDTDYNSKHWHYKNSLGGANLEGAWDITTGSDSNIIAVIDTGILPHIELISKTLQGYDFISDIAMANDGDGRDDNATDSGDWCHDGDDCYLSSYDYADSSWHGTHVSGTIAAQSNNAQGMTGINWEGKILPLRVLGKGGGYTSDIADAMLWAAGLHVEGVPDNQNPAKILNLSLGTQEECSQSFQDAIDQVNATGSIIVVAAGNDNEDASSFSPANCKGVITVGALSEDATKANYSNYGELVDISAPGGDENIDSMIYSTLDSGSTTANNDNSYGYYQGTSMAAPHVAGIASLVTNLIPDAKYEEVNCILQKSAREFPVQSDCSTDFCGAGIVDATNALTFSLNPETLTPKYTDTLYNEVQSYLYTFDFLSDKVDLSSLWFIDQDRLNSNEISDSNSTSYTLDLLNISMYDISFDWGVSSEEEFDYFYFYGGENNTLWSSGEYTGTHQAYRVSTTDEKVNLEWAYLKDAYVSDYNDSAWVDNIFITTYKTTSSLSFLKDNLKKTIIVSNTSCKALSINNLTLSDSTNFTLINNCLEPLNFGETCSISVEYIASFNTKDTTTLSYDTSDPSISYVEKVFDVRATIVPIINYLLF